MNVAHKALGRSRLTHASALVQRLLSRVVGRWLVVIVLVLIWQGAASVTASVYFPTPVDIVSRMQHLWLSAGPPWFFTDAVSTDVLPSLARMLIGWGMAVLVGVSLGVAIGSLRAVSDTLQPVVSFLRSTPGPALIPVFLMILGTGDTMRVILIAFGTVWPILLNTIEGVRSVEPVQLETAHAFGLRRAARLRRVVIPSASPHIFAGMRVGVSIALTLMVVSELVVATNGIGYQLQKGQQYFLLTDMWANIVLLAGLGFLLNMIFETFERRSLKWHRGARRRA